MHDDGQAASSRQVRGGVFWRTWTRWACGDQMSCRWVSDYIPQIVAYISRIQANGIAYEHDGSVYFDTAAFECALSRYCTPGFGMGST